MGINGKHWKLVSLLKAAVALTALLVVATGCASQSTDFKLIEPNVVQSDEVFVVVTPRSSNPCWTNGVEVAETAARNLSVVYDDVFITGFEEAVSGDRLVFQVFGWAYRRGGICFGNYRVSVGEGLEVKDNGYIDTISPAVSPKRKAILGAPARMNALVLAYVDEVSQQFANQIKAMR